MASVTTAQLSSDLDFALDDFSVTLTTVLPTANVGTTFSATRQPLEDGFLVEDNGREVKLDTRFFVNINGLSTIPAKGWVLNDGTNVFKVIMLKKAQDNVMLTVDCSARYSKGRG